VRLCEPRLRISPRPRVNALSHLAIFAVTFSIGCTKSHDVGNLRGQDAGESTPSDAGAPEIVSDDLCARLSEIQCSSEQHCCDAPMRSMARCQSDLASSCKQTLYLDQIAAGSKTGFDEGAVDRAFGALEQLTNNCDPAITHWALSDDGLRGLFPGTLARDQNCSAVGGATADRGIVAAALSSCRRADGLACLPKSLLGDWTCAPKQPNGGSCLTDDNCEGDAICNNAGQPALGSCTPRLPLGAACTDANQCTSLACSDQQCAEPDVQTVYCPAQPTSA
jgi:hypothetical protein